MYNLLVILRSRYENEICIIDNMPVFCSCITCPETGDDLMAYRRRDRKNYAVVRGE